MTPYVLSPEALADLQEIWAYIAADNPAAADAVEADIYQACELLARNPRLGHKRKDLTSERVLFWPVRGRYLLVYRLSASALQIARILHAARDAEAEL